MSDEMNPDEIRAALGESPETEEPSKETEAVEKLDILYQLLETIKERDRLSTELRLWMERVEQLEQELSHYKQSL